MEVKLLTPHASLPRRASEGAAGYDLTSVVNVCINPGKRGLISTGVSIKLPKGVYGRIAPRSGLSVRHGLNVGAGVIDEDYRGEMQCYITEGERIAQLICEKCEYPEVTQVDSLDGVKVGLGLRGIEHFEYSSSVFGAVGVPQLLNRTSVPQQKLGNHSEVHLRTRFSRLIPVSKIGKRIIKSVLALFVAQLLHGVAHPDVNAVKLESVLVHLLERLEADAAPPGP